MRQETVRNIGGNKKAQSTEQDLCGAHMMARVRLIFVCFVYLFSGCNLNICFVMRSSWLNI